MALQVLSDVLEERAKGLAVMGATDGLGEDVTDLDDVELVAKIGLVLVLRYAICCDELVDSAHFHAVEGVSAKYAVGDQSIHGRGAFFLEKLSRSGNLGKAGQWI